MKPLSLFVSFVCMLVLAGCSTVNMDWEKALSINTLEAYDEFLRKYPDSEYTQQALQKVEPMRFQKAKEDGTTRGYSLYLMRYPDGSSARKARAQLKALRCADRTLVKEGSPAWLRRGDDSHPLRRTSFYLDNSYIGVEPSDIGRGYKACCDDPDFPLDLMWEQDHLVYFGGKGVIVGPDGTQMLMGYDCR